MGAGLHSGTFVLPGDSVLKMRIHGLGLRNLCGDRSEKVFAHGRENRHQNIRHRLPFVGLQLGREDGEEVGCLSQTERIHFQHGGRFGGWRAVDPRRPDQASRES